LEVFLEEATKMNLIARGGNNQWVFLIFATLALGSRLKQGFTRLQAKKEDRESHLVLMRVQKSVRA
jgi:hypothetical protein